MTTARQIYYPASDGKPMGETELHVLELLRLLATLRDHFAGHPDVYVGGDLILYYEEGNPRRSVVPDLFVALGVPKEPHRPIYKLWEEHIPPTCVIEITSRSTRSKDERDKPELYARLGVSEYFLYDPLAEYLTPSLQGLRLVRGVYSRIAPRPDGSLASVSLGLALRLTGNRLHLFDTATGARLLDPSEQAAAARQQAAIAEQRAETERRRAEEQEQRADTEESARRALERRVAELEARLRGGDTQ